MTTETIDSTHIPKLRFPEFFGEWFPYRFDEKFSIGSGRDYKHAGSGNIPVYGTGGLMTHIDEFLHDGESVCIGRKGTIDNPMLLTGKFWTVDTLFYTHDYRETTADFIYLIFQNINWQKHNEASGVPSLSKRTIQSIKSFFPPLPEQEKIAAFLGAVDDKIAQLSRKKDLLEQYKKGCMQKLFSKVVRFKKDDGSDFPDWEVKRLGELCSITTGRLDANAQVEGGQYPFFTCAREVFEIDNFAFDEDALLISGNGANVGYIHHYKGKFNAYQRTYVLFNFQAHITYVEKFLERHLRKRIFSQVKEGNTPYIVKSTLADMPVKIPNLKEQQKIANFLSAIDTKIDLVASELDLAKAFKKGLLQQMFLQ